MTEYAIINRPRVNPEAALSLWIKIMMANVTTVSTEPAARVIAMGNVHHRETAVQKVPAMVVVIMMVKEKAPVCMAKRLSLRRNKIPYICLHD